MGTEGFDPQHLACGETDVEDCTFMQEIQLLGAVIAEVQGRTDHLSPEELDQLLERAAAVSRPTAPTRGVLPIPPRPDLS